MHCPSQSKGPGVPRGERLEQGGMGVGLARRAGGGVWGRPGQGPGKEPGRQGAAFRLRGLGGLVQDNLLSPNYV